MIQEGNLKNRTEIQRAHDLLHYIVTLPEDHGLSYDSREATAMRETLSALGWVIGCACGENFQGNLDLLREVLREAGIVEIDMGRLISPEESEAEGLD